MNNKKKHAKVLMFLCLVVFVCYYTFLLNSTIHLSMDTDTIDYIEIVGIGGHHVLTEDSEIQDLVDFLESLKLTKNEEEEAKLFCDVEMTIHYFNGKADEYFLNGFYLVNNNIRYDTKIFLLEEIEKILIKHEFIGIEAAGFVTQGTLGDERQRRQGQDKGTVLLS